MRRLAIGHQMPPVLQAPWGVQADQHRTDHGKTPTKQTNQTGWCNTP